MKPNKQVIECHECICMHVFKIYVLIKLENIVNNRNILSKGDLQCV